MSAPVLSGSVRAPTGGMLAAAAALAITSTVVGRAITVSAPGVHDAELFRLFGDAWREGWIPYRDLWNNKPPGIFAVAAAIGALFPTWVAGIAAFESAAVLLASFAVYRIVRELTAGDPGGRRAAAVAGVASAVALNLAALNEGGFTTELALAPFAALSALAFVHAWLGGSLAGLAAAGASAGVAGLFKPPGLAPLLAQMVFVVGAAARGGWVARNGGERRGRDAAAAVGALLFGAGVAWVPALAYFGAHGAAGDMLEATFLFNLGYAATNRSGVLITAVKTALALLPVAPLALAAGWLGVEAVRRRGAARGPSPANPHSLRLLVLAWVFFDLLGVVAGGRFYGHYVLAAVPSLATASGIWLADQSVARRAARLATAFVLIPLLALQAWEARLLVAGSRTPAYWKAPAAAILRARTVTGTPPTLFTWDYLPALYVHTGSRPPTSHPCVPIWGREAVRDSVAAVVLEALERTPPSFLVDGGGAGRVPGRDPGAFHAYEGLVARRYELLYMDPDTGVRVFRLSEAS